MSQSTDYLVSRPPKCLGEFLQKIVRDKGAEILKLIKLNHKEISMKEKTEFKVGDKVKYGDAEGVVYSVDKSAYPVEVNFKDSTYLSFTADGYLTVVRVEGFPRLTLVSRAERFVEKEVYHPLFKSSFDIWAGSGMFNTKEEAMNYRGNSDKVVGYAVSKVFIKESEG